MIHLIVFAKNKHGKAYFAQTFVNQTKSYQKKLKTKIQRRGAETYQIFLLPYRQISLLH